MNKIRILMLFFSFNTFNLWAFNNYALLDSTTYSTLSFTLVKNDCNNRQIPTNPIKYQIITKKFKDTVGLKLPLTRVSDNEIIQKEQEKVNDQGTCTLLFFNNMTSTKTLAKNDCGPNFVGRMYAYFVPANKYINNVSQDSVESLAMKDLNDSAQLKANLFGVCVPYFYNSAKDTTLISKTCPSTTLARPYKYTVLASMYKDTISQKSVNDKAIADVNANAQNTANDSGVCVPLRTYTVKVIKAINQYGCSPSEDRSNSNPSQDCKRLDNPKFQSNSYRCLPPTSCTQ